MNLPDELAQILIAFTQDRFVTALEQMANLSVLAVMVLAVGRKQALHDPANWVVPPFDGR